MNGSWPILTRLPGTPSKRKRAIVGYFHFQQIFELVHVPFARFSIGKRSMLLVIRFMNCQIQSQIAGLDSSLLLNRFDPKTQCEVFALRITELPAQLLLIALFEDFQIERDDLGQVFHIISVPLNVALQL